MALQPETFESRPTPRSIRDYARGARLAVRLQLAVAAFAFIATLVFGAMIARQTARLAQVNTELAAASSRVSTADNATRAVLQAAAALATREREQYDAAIISLDKVRSDLGQDAADADTNEASAASAQLRDVRFSVTRTLASALFTHPERTEADLGRAITLETGNLREGGITDDQTFSSTIALATFQCERNDGAAVKALLTPEFVSAHPNTGANGVLPPTCREMAGVAAPAIVAFDASKADPAFRIKTLHLQIAEEQDRIRAVELAKELCAKGYSVPGIDQVNASKMKPGGEVIYYFPQQASEAAFIGRQVLIKPGAASPDGGAFPAPRQLTGFTNLDRHTAELWIPPHLESNTVASRPPLTAGELQQLRGFSCGPKGQSSGDDLLAQIAQLTSDQKTDRLAAGQVLANQIRTDDDGAAIGALLGQLEGERLDALSAAGRLNVLYILNIETGWSSRTEKQRLARALADIETRARTKGIVIGGQTRDCINQLKTKLDGKASSDRCGGL